MAIKTHLHFIVLIIQKSVISRLTKYILLFLNIVVLWWMADSINTVIITIFQTDNRKLNTWQTNNLSVPKDILEMESIKRESYRDNISDDFSIRFHSLMEPKSKNKYASNSISIKRRLKDIRKPGCLLKHYVVEELPKASIVIIFCNEPLSFILRTIWSILNQTPRKLLHELILVDDGSNNTDITNDLPWYIKHRLKHENIRLIRNPTQKHLIVAKLIGAKNASGDALVFLEGHCEVTPGWIEPLLHHIANHTHAIAIPMLDFIDYSNLDLQERNPEGRLMNVDFDWGGSFGYVNYNAMKDSNISNLDPLASPIMTGGVFAVNRKYFWSIGGYDSGMYGWGGENFELSFKTWLCGGRLDIIPCSHVAHLDRLFENRPYKNPENSIAINMMRTAEVWMDQYKRLFYLFYTNYKDDKRLGDIRDQVILKEQLNCKPFSWYVKNIIPNKYIPDEDSKMYGRLRNGRYTDMCVDDLGRSSHSSILSSNDVYTLGQYICNPDLSLTQYFSISKNDEFRSFYVCAEVSKDSPFDKIKMKMCNGDLNQKWQRTARNSLKHVASGKCLTSPSVLNSSTEVRDLIGLTCNGGLEQTWNFEFNPNVQYPINTIIDTKVKLNGRLQNGRFKDMCLDDYSEQGPYLLSQYPCIGGNGTTTQNFSITEDNELRHFTYCAAVFLCSGDFCGNQYRILMTTCNGEAEQKWKRTKWNGLQHVKSSKCLTSPIRANNIKDGNSLIALQCDESLDQVWKFET